MLRKNNTPTTKNKNEEQSGNVPIDKMGNVNKELKSGKARPK